MADPPPHHRRHRNPRRVDQPRRTRLDDLLREVLPNRTRRPAATHQHLPGALGPAEIQTAAVVQEGQTMVARALAQATPTLRPLGLDDRVLNGSDETSGMTGDCHVPFCGSPGLKCPGLPGNDGEVLDKSRPVMRRAVAECGDLFTWI